MIRHRGCYPSKGCPRGTDPRSRTQMKKIINIFILGLVPMTVETKKSYNLLSANWSQEKVVA